MLRWRISEADALFDLVHQTGSTVFGGEGPDQNPAQQNRDCHELDECGDLCIGFQFFETRAICSISAVKKTDDFEEGTIENFNPSGIRLGHDIIG